MNCAVKLGEAGIEPAARCPYFYLSFALPKVDTSRSYCERVIGIMEPWRTFGGSEYLSQLGC